MGFHGGKHVTPILGVPGGLRAQGEGFGVLRSFGGGVTEYSWDDLTSCTLNVIPASGPFFCVMSPPPPPLPAQLDRLILLSAIRTSPALPPRALSQKQPLPILVHSACVCRAHGVLCCLPRFSPRLSGLSGGGGEGEAGRARSEFGLRARALEQHACCCSVTLAKLLCPSGPQFPHMENTERSISSFRVKATELRTDHRKYLAL